MISSDGETIDSEVIWHSKQGNKAEPTIIDKPSVSREKAKSGSNQFGLRK